MNWRRIHDISLKGKLVIPFLFLAAMGAAALFLVSYRFQASLIQVNEDTRLRNLYQVFLNDIEARKNVAPESGLPGRQEPGGGRSPGPKGPKPFDRPAVSRLSDPGKGFRGQAVSLSPSPGHLIFAASRAGPVRGKDGGLPADDQPGPGDRSRRGRDRTGGSGSEHPQRGPCFSSGPSDRDGGMRALPGEAASG